MAIEAERLLAIFEARFTSLEKALAKAKAQSKDAFSSIEADGTSAEAALSGIGARGTPGIDKASRAIRSLQGQTGNLAAQFNDIGVQLAGGTSPFLIALQQGTQINQVLGQSGARAAVTALGGAFLSLVNPVSLATIAIIAGGGYVAQYFLSLLDGGQKSAETLQKEADLIQRVADKWGAALPALKAYADAQKELADQQDRATASQAAFDAVQQKILASFGDAAAALADFQSNLQTIGDNEAANALGNQFQELRDRVKAGTVTQQDFADMLRVVQQTMDDTHLSGNGLVSILQQIEAAAAANIATFRSLANEVSRNSTLGGPVDAATRAMGFATVPLPDTAPVPDRTPNREEIGAEQDAYAARQARIGARGQRLDAGDRFAESIQSVKDRTEALKQEAATIGLSYEEQQKRRMALDLEQEALRRLREEAMRKGQTDLDSIHLSPEQVAAIDAASEAYARQADELRKVQQAQEKADQAASDFYDTFKSDAIDAITGAQNLGDALSDLAKKLGDMLLNSAFDSIFKPAGNGDSGGPLGGIFSAIGNWITGAFAGGTSSAPGGVALVGEKGPELVDLPRGSRVTPADVSQRILTGGASGAPSITYAPVNHFQGTSEELAQMQAVMARDRAEFSGNVLKTMRLAKQTRNWRG